nr:hypothetical protein CFP56_11980 [Quercus suber]
MVCEWRWAMERYKDSIAGDAPPRARLPSSPPPSHLTRRSISIFPSCSTSSAHGSCSRQAPNTPYTARDV